MNWGIAMAEIAGFQNYRSIGHLLVENDEERVKQYNTLITQFPTVLTAKATGAKPRTYYEATNANANVAPTVDFSKTAPKN